MSLDLGHQLKVDEWDLLWTKTYLRPSYFRLDFVLGVSGWTLS